MRALFTLLVLSLIGGGTLVPASFALQRTAVAIDDDIPAWSAGATCSIAYYNICTGWIWVYEGGHLDLAGTIYDRCGDDCTVFGSWVWSGSRPQAGRGYTGTIGLWAVDANDCPSGAPLSSFAYLPDHGWNFTQWQDVPVPARFALVLEFSDVDGYWEPHIYATDHPAAGPTGPQACGVCFPTTRTNRSFFWGQSSSPLCPGSTFFDGVCDAQLLQRVQMSCVSDVEGESWGRLKQLFR